MPGSAASVAEKRCLPANEGARVKKNYYRILDVSVDAPTEEIKSAYRRLVKEYHPDHFGEESAPFRAIQQAYAVLSDPGRRQAYDRTLRERQPRTHRGFHTTRAGRSHDIEPLIPESDPIGPGSRNRPTRIYRQGVEAPLDGFGTRVAYGANSAVEMPRTLPAIIEVTPEQALRGGTVRIALPVRYGCPACLGTGGVGFFPCRRCLGSGAEAGEVPVRIPFPAHLRTGFEVRLPLRRYGLGDLLLDALFRVVDRF